MPLILPHDLPAAIRLREEGFSILPPDHKADLHIALVNLMPMMAETEYDFLQLLAPSQRNIKVSFCNMRSHTSKHTPVEHIDAFYCDFNSIRPTVDAAIITGAPLENVRFEAVDYWAEVTAIFDYLSTHRIPTLNICWAAFASIYHRYGIDWVILPEKISGLYPHTIYHPDPLLAGIEQGFLIPHSRHAAWQLADIESCGDITLVAGGELQGPYMIVDRHAPHYYIIGHGEYHRMTLHNEYFRDLAKGMDPIVPRNYFPGDDPQEEPIYNWHETALQIFENWLNTIK